MTIQVLFRQIPINGFIKKDYLMILFICFVTLGACKRSEVQTADNKNHSLPTNDSEMVGDTSETPPNLHLSLRHTWTFDYQDGFFPCDSVGFTIKGFAVEDDSTFYIMGGTPAAIAKYSGTQLLKRKELFIDLYASYNAIFHLTGDSIYFVDEQEHIIFVLDKSLQKDPSAYALPIEPQYSIEWGDMFEHSYQISTQNTDSVWSYLTLETWRFNYPNVFIEKTKGFVERPGYCQLQDSVQETLSYYGRMGKYRLFMSPPEYDDYHVIITDSTGIPVYKEKLTGFPRVAAVSGYEKHYGALQSSNLQVLKGNSIFFTGYDDKTHLFTILQYELVEESS